MCRLNFSIKKEWFLPENCTATMSNNVYTCIGQDTLLRLSL